MGPDPSESGPLTSAWTLRAFADVSRGLESGFWRAPGLPTADGVRFRTPEGHRRVRTHTCPVFRSVGSSRSGRGPSPSGLMAAPGSLSCAPDPVRIPLHAPVRAGAWTGKATSCEKGRIGTATALAGTRTGHGARGEGQEVRAPGVMRCNSWPQQGGRHDSDAIRAPAGFGSGVDHHHVERVASDTLRIGGPVHYRSAVLGATDGRTRLAGNPGIRFRQHLTRTPRRTAINWRPRHDSNVRPAV